MRTRGPVSARKRVALIAAAVATIVLSQFAVGASGMPQPAATSYRAMSGLVTVNHVDRVQISSSNLSSSAVQAELRLVSAAGKIVAAKSVTVGPRESAVLTFSPPKATRLRGVVAYAAGSPDRAYLIDTFTIIGPDRKQSASDITRLSFTFDWPDPINYYPSFPFNTGLTRFEPGQAARLSVSNATGKASAFVLYLINGNGDVIAKKTAVLQPGQSSVLPKVGQSAVTLRGVVCLPAQSVAECLNGTGGMKYPIGGGFYPVTLEVLTTGINGPWAQTVLAGLPSIYTAA